MNKPKYRRILNVKTWKTILWCFIFLFLTACQTEQESSQKETSEERLGKNQIVENEYAFSKLYGYIRFFHPSDEASDINWHNFAIYGAEKVHSSQTNEELRETLEELYLPIAPTVVFYDPSTEEVPDIDTTTDELIAWQHKGLAMDDLAGPSIYSSERVEAKIENGELILSENALFNDYPSKEDVINVQLTDELAVSIPLTLGTEKIEGETINNLTLKDTRTLGGTKDSINAFKNLQKELSRVSEDLDDKQVQFAATTVVWNNFQHFYPNFHVMDTDWEKQLIAYLEKTYEASTNEDYRNVLMELLEKTGDGHANISDTRIPFTSSLTLESREYWPFQVDVIDSKVILTVTDEESPFEEGDRLISIGDKNVKSWLEDVTDFIPGSSQLKEYRSLQYVHELSGEEIVIERDGTEHTFTEIEKSKVSLDEFKRDSPLKELEDNIWYVNLTQPVLDEIKENRTNLNAAKGIIFDLRGYPYSFEETLEIIQLLTDQPLIGPIFRFHGAIYPDRKSPILIDEQTGFEAGKGTINSEIVFLSYSGSMSMPEYFLKYVKNNQLGTIIGEATAGADGNMYTYSIPGKLLGGITMAEVLNTDGSQTHLVGVEPDIWVDRTRDGIKSKQDEYINKALEYIRAK